MDFRAILIFKKKMKFLEKIYDDVASEADEIMKKPLFIFGCDL